MRLLTRTTTQTTSELLGISPRRARAYARVLAAFGEPLPAGWDPAGGVAGWDLVLVAPKTLSVLARVVVVDQPWTTVRIAEAHHHAVTVVARQLAETTRVEVPRLVDHPLDPAGHPLQHTHVIFGALVQRDGRWQPLDAALLRKLVGPVMASYHRRLRHGVAGVVDYRWGPVGPDGAAELLGVPQETLVAFSGAHRPLGEIAACARAVGDLEP
jgi:hypothetical protein